MSEKFEIKIKVSNNEIRHLLKMYGERLSHYQAVSDDAYLKWNSARFQELVKIALGEG